MVFDPGLVDRERRRRFERLYAELAVDVTAYVLRRVDEATAADIVADVFLVAWRRLDELPVTPLPWLLGVARKTVGNHLRSARRRGALVERLQATQARSGTDDSRAEEVLAALASLSEGDKETLMLVAWDGLSPKEAAAVLGCSSGTFRVRLHRARSKLTRVLSEQAATASKHPRFPTSPTTESIE